MTTVTDRPAETTALTDDGARLAVTLLAPLTAVSGSTVVLAHGWGATRRVWNTVTDRLIRAGHRVVVYDQRGHGASRPGSEPFTVERLGRDVEAVLSHVDAGPATVLVGHSGGGFAALSHAVSGTRGVGGMVLLSSAAHGQDTPESEARMMGGAPFSWAVSRPALGRRLLARTMGRRVDPRALEVNRQMFAATAPQVRADAFRSSRGMDLRTALAGVNTPALVLAGAEDRVVEPALGRVVAETLPDARFEEVPGAGHLLPLEAPGVVVRAVCELADRAR